MASAYRKKLPFDYVVEGAKNLSGQEAALVQAAIEELEAPLPPEAMPGPVFAVAMQLRSNPRARAIVAEKAGAYAAARGGRSTN